MKYTKPSGKNISNAIEVLTDGIFTDGGHHKQWALDQALRFLLGDKYDKYREKECDGEYGPNSYEWDQGIVP